MRKKGALPRSPSQKNQLGVGEIHCFDLLHGFHGGNRTKWGKIESNGDSIFFWNLKRLRMKEPAFQNKDLDRLNLWRSRSSGLYDAQPETCRRIGAATKAACDPFVIERQPWPCAQHYWWLSPVM